MRSTRAALLFAMPAAAAGGFPMTGTAAPPLGGCAVEAEPPAVGRYATVHTARPSPAERVR
jgi:hypothetical protein